MSIVTGRVHILDETAKEMRRIADAAWDRYSDVCRMAGSDDERQWAFGRALKAEQNAADARNREWAGRAGKAQAA